MSRADGVGSKPVSLVAGVGVLWVHGIMLSVMNIAVMFLTVVIFNNTC